MENKQVKPQETIFMIINRLLEIMLIKIKKLLLRLFMIIGNILLKQLMIIKNSFKILINSIMIEMYIRMINIMINIIIMDKIIRFRNKAKIKILIIQVIITKTN
jgi:hypothetical protein